MKAMISNKTLLFSLRCRKLNFKSEMYPHTTTLKMVMQYAVIL